MTTLSNKALDDVAQEGEQSLKHLIYILVLLAPVLAASTRASVRPDQDHTKLVQ